MNKWRIYEHAGPLYYVLDQDGRLVAARLSSQEALRLKRQLEASEEVLTDCDPGDENDSKEPPSADR